MAAAVRWIEQGNGGRRIEQLSRYIGLSQSALERRFRRIVGVTPKRFASVVRLRHAAELCRANVDLTTAAHAAGYFDQSHFINHFRRATGRSPQAFFRRNQSPGTRAIDAEFFQFSALAPRLP
ncbi:MAG: bacterial regulatory helix-turn-helix s, AraC family protein [Candidatus Solibacter sp.]|nr:bacterial regulatory helix-turn-helix s, AraC family protein [Candidatus Solibacter sp.]